MKKLKKLKKSARKRKNTTSNMTTNMMMVQLPMNLPLPMIPPRQKCLLNRRIWGREQGIRTMVKEDSRKSKDLTIIKD